MHTLDPDTLLSSSEKLKRVETPTHACIAASLPVKTSPSYDAETVSEILFGEQAELLATTDEWTKIACAHDGYIGWILRDHLSPVTRSPTHKVRAVSTHLYTLPDLKSHPITWLPMGANITVTDDTSQAGFVQTRAGGWVFEAHIAAMDAVHDDPVEVAKSLIGAPYLWGGRSVLGLDCSALVQLSLAQCGLGVLRDSSMQAKSIGRALHSGEAPAYGDLAFFPGHVGWMLDSENLLHANATHMAVTIDPVETVKEWVAKETSGPPFLGFRRIEDLAQ